MTQKFDDAYNLAGQKEEEARTIRSRAARELADFCRDGVQEFVTKMHHWYLGATGDRAERDVTRYTFWWPFRFKYRVTESEPDHYVIANGAAYHGGPKEINPVHYNLEKWEKARRLKHISDVPFQDINPNHLHFLASTIEELRREAHVLASRS